MELFQRKFSVKKWGHLKTLGTQMGYPVGLLNWEVVKTNTRQSFGRFCQTEDVSTRLQFTVYATVAFLRSLLFF